MNNNKQNSVEWLIKEFSEILGPIKTKAFQNLLLVDAIEQAKAIHKQEIEEAFASGIDNEWCINKYLKKKPQQYYNETFGGKK